MSFTEQLKKTLDNQYNVSITENGALGYKTTNHPLLDMNFKVSSYRKRSDGEIIQDFMNAFAEDNLMAMKWLFYSRDARQGLGERRLFRVISKYLADDKPDMMKALIPLFAEYGRYDDLISLMDTAIGDDVVSYIKDTLTNDMKAVSEGKSATLLAKWLPSENASSPATRNVARQLIKKLGISAPQYRKMLSKIRTHLNIVEKFMSRNEWSGIDYEAVPSKANLLYNSAFLRHDEVRRREFLGAVERGEAKINSSVTFPHEIVHKYVETGPYNFYNRKVDKGLEAMWKALPNLVDDTETTMVVADGSGSMYTRVGGGSNATALDVANALAIYFAERCSGEFKNKYITFSSKPQLVDLNGSTLRDNIAIALQHHEVANTNIEATFDLILNTAINGNMKQEDLPKNILIISDMEFDSATSSSYYGRYSSPNARLFETISNRFKRNGYEMPRLIFWNVCGRTNTIPVKENDLGVALVSGFSVNIVKMVLGDALDPYQLLVDALNTERYYPVEEALKGVNLNS